jgi:hypothetical protein
MIRKKEISLGSFGRGSSALQMTAPGHLRRFASASATSAVPLKADLRLRRNIPRGGPVRDSSSAAKTVTRPLGDIGSGGLRFADPPYGLCVCRGSVSRVAQVHFRDAADTRYAKSGEVNIAYQVFGEGPPNLVFAPPFVSNIENYWNAPGFASWLLRMGSYARVVMFDKRGTGGGGKRNSIELANAGALDQQRDALRQTRRHGHVIAVIKSALE